MHSTYQNIINQKQNQYQHQRRLYNRLYLSTRDGIRRPKINQLDVNRQEQLYNRPDRRVMTAKPFRNVNKNSYFTTEHLFEELPISNGIIRHKNEGMLFDKKSRHPFCLPADVEHCAKNVEFDLNAKDSSEIYSGLNKSNRPNDENSSISSDGNNSDEEKTTCKSILQTSDSYDTVIKPIFNKKSVEENSNNHSKIKNIAVSFEKNEVKKRKTEKKTEIQPLLDTKSKVNCKAENKISICLDSEIINPKSFKSFEKNNAPNKQYNTKTVSKKYSESNKKVFQSDEKNVESTSSCGKSNQCKKIYLKKYIIPSSSSSEKYSIRPEEMKYRKKKRVKRKKDNNKMSIRSRRTTSRLRMRDIGQTNEKTAITPPLIDINNQVKQEKNNLKSVSFKSLPNSMLNEEKRQTDRLQNIDKVIDKNNNCEIQNHLPKNTLISKSMFENFSGSSKINNSLNFSTETASKTISNKDVFKKNNEESCKKPVCKCITELCKTYSIYNKKLDKNCVCSLNKIQYKFTEELENKYFIKTVDRLHLRHDNKSKGKNIFKKEILEKCLYKNLISYCDELSEKICKYVFDLSVKNLTQKKTESFQLTNIQHEDLSFFNEIDQKNSDYYSFKETNSNTFHKIKTTKQNMDTNYYSNNISYKKTNNSSKPCIINSYNKIEEKKTDKSTENNFCSQNTKFEMDKLKKKQKEVIKTSQEIIVAGVK